MKPHQLILFVDPPGIPVDTIRPETFPRGSQAQGNQILGLGATRCLSSKTVQDIPGTVKSPREPLPSLRENRRKQFRFRIHGPNLPTVPCYFLARSSEEHGPDPPTWRIRRPFGSDPNPRLFPGNSRGRNL